MPGMGASPLYVGEAPSGGYFVAPAVFAVTDVDHPLVQEELFGPILALIQVDREHGTSRVRPRRVEAPPYLLSHPAGTGC